MHFTEAAVINFW